MLEGTGSGWTWPFSACSMLRRKLRLQFPTVLLTASLKPQLKTRLWRSLGPPPVTSIGVSPRHCQLVARGSVPGWQCWYPEPSFARERGTVGLHLASREEEGPPLWVGGGGLGLFMKESLDSYPACKNRSARLALPATPPPTPLFLHPRGSGHLKSSSVRAGEIPSYVLRDSISVLSQGCSSHHRLPWPLGWQVGTPGTAPRESLSSGSHTWVHAVRMVSELGLQAPASELPSVTMGPGCFTFCSLPLFLLQIPTRCNPFPFLRMLFWSLKHQKGSGVPLIPHRV